MDEKGRENQVGREEEGNRRRGGRKKGEKRHQVRIEKEANRIRQRRGMEGRKVNKKGRRNGIEKKRKD